ncbi:MAG: tetratricopeptide repeat protein [Prevotella sp.]|nr:tetratricopeptide repeat protein [Prevotella sp.]
MKKLLYIVLLMLPFMLQAQVDGDKTTTGDKAYLIDSLYADFIGQEVKDNYDSAYTILKRCYELDPEAAELNFQMALYKRMYAKTDTTKEAEEVMPEIIELLKKAYNKEPNNKKYANTLLNACAQGQDTTMIVPLLERLIDIDKSNEQYLTLLIRIYDSRGEYTKELELLDRLETIGGKEPAINLVRADVYRDFYSEKKALKYINSLIKEDPTQSVYHLFLAQHFSAKEDYKKALPYYHTALELNPTDGGAKYSYINCLEKMGKEAEARQMKIDIMNDPKALSELKVQIVRDLLEEFETEENGTERMMQMFRTALEQPQENTDLTNIYVQYMAMQKCSLDSIAHAMDDLLQKEPTNEQAYMNLLAYYGGKDDKEKVVDVCNRAINNGIDKLEIHYYQAGYNYQIGKKDEALRIYEKAVSNRKFANNPKMYAECYGMIGTLYHEKDSFQKAFEAFEEGLKWNPDDNGTLNNYAYYLSIADKDLEKAERMSKKTIIAEPNNGTYLDTYAWILYKMGNYKDAVTYINRAIKSPNEKSAEEYEHAGDIYFMLKDTDAAVAYWELAKQKAEEEGKDANDLDRKIKTKKL